jgi:hypothetical protein
MSGIFEHISQFGCDALVLLSLEENQAHQQNHHQDDQHRKQAAEERLPALHFHQAGAAQVTALETARLSRRIDVPALCARSRLDLFAEYNMSAGWAGPVFVLKAAALGA